MVQKIEEEKIKESLTEAKLLFCCGIKAKFEPFSIVKGLSLSLLVLSMRTKQRLKTQHEAKNFNFNPKTTKISPKIALLATKYKTTMLK